jgi:hypothetical protein
MRIQKHIEAWKRLPEDLDPDRTGEVLIRAFKDGDHRAEKAYSWEQRIINSENEKGRIDITINPDRQEEFRAKRRIVKWKGFYDQDGNPLECNEANKLLFSRETGFMDWLNSEGSKLDQIAAGKAEEEEKNSEPMPHGSQGGDGQRAKIVKPAQTNGEASRSGQRQHGKNG